MSGTADLEDLYAAIEKTAALLELPCSPERVRPVLRAYAEVIPQAVIAFRLGTGERYTGDLDWRFTVPNDVDPYAVAVANGLVEAVDHPVGTLLGEIAEHCPIGSFGVDFGVAGGFKKIYVFFPPDNMQRLETLVGLPSMPRSLAQNLDFFARHGLDGAKVNVFGIDYRHRTVNVYFGGLPPEVLEPGSVRAMMRELDLPEPSEELLALGRRAFGIYTSLGWADAQIERYCFAVMTPDAASLPVRIEPRIERFLKDVPYAAADGRFIYYAGTSVAGEENFKLQSYFSWQPRMLDQMLLK
jgi:hypothetical protein